MGGSYLLGNWAGGNPSSDRAYLIPKSLRGKLKRLPGENGQKRGGGAGWGSLPRSAATPDSPGGNNQESCSPTQVKAFSSLECLSHSEAHPELGLLSRADVCTLLSQRLRGHMPLLGTAEL